MRLFRRKPSEIITSGDPVQPGLNPETESLMNEMSRLYRERIRALYNRDTAMLATIAEQIESIKKKLGAA
ncbi:MAG TPA: hypothetical protein VMU17_06045 [Elusimicrobiota bacterium]|nr:hypothetical protein [Elusimicrobiota bacterium]